MKKLVAVFDGTWNKQEVESEGSNTNACRIYQAVKAQNDPQQLAEYFEGVGTKWYERIRGGMGGYGLSRVIKQGYEWLSKNYRLSDGIYLFGFSRGAYTARSLVGLIRKCGLLQPQNGQVDSALVDEAYDIYRLKSGGADVERAIKFKQAHSREARINFLGVWDTVGALGVPIKGFSLFNKSYYEFHDTELSSIVENAYHAVAVDEHRKDYMATLWDPKHKPNQKIEQRWFVGAHSDVGGGYHSRAHADVSLCWMQRAARECGLKVEPITAQVNIAADYSDSYQKFLGGVYRFLNDRFYRPVNTTPNGNEVIDDSVIERMKGNPGYTPKNFGLESIPFLQPDPEPAEMETIRG